jgi:hypothetical protein
MFIQREIEAASSHVRLWSASAYCAPLSTKKQSAADRPPPILETKPEHYSGIT